MYSLRSFGKEPDDALQKLAKEYIGLNLRFESELIKHKLALQYFEWRSFYLSFLPVTIIATLITIFGFLVSGVQIDSANNEGSADNTGNGNEVSGNNNIPNKSGPLVNAESAKYWSLVMGILGAISTLLNAIAKRKNYQSQADMHRSAVKALEKLCMAIEFERDWFERNASDPEMAQKKNLAADLKSHQASFKAMLDACCDSPVPYKIEQTFTVLDQFLRLGENTFLRDVQYIETRKYYYHKIWQCYSTDFWWPMKVPTFDVQDSVRKWDGQILKMKQARKKMKESGAKIESGEEVFVPVQYSEMVNHQVEIIQLPDHGQEPDVQLHGGLSPSISEESDAEEENLANLTKTFRNNFLKN